MLVLGIESSAHTFGVGIVSDGRVLANEKDMFKLERRDSYPPRSRSSTFRMPARLLKEQ